MSPRFRSCLSHQKLPLGAILSFGVWNTSSLCWMDYSLWYSFKPLQNPDETCTEPGGHEKNGGYVWCNCAKNEQWAWLGRHGLVHGWKSCKWQGQLDALDILGHIIHIIHIVTENPLCSQKVTIWKVISAQSRGSLAPSFLGKWKDRYYGISMIHWGSEKCYNVFV